jgi:predicted ATP-dependent serine protease
VKQQCLYRLERREAIRQTLVTCRDCSWRYRAFVECRCSLTEQNACSVGVESCPGRVIPNSTSWRAMAVLPLVRHERELGTLDDLVDRVGERGGALVVCGEAGIGKSALLGAVRTRFRAKVA